VARPVSISIETFGTAKVDEDQLLTAIRNCFELRPAGIIQTYDLQRLPSDRGGRFYQEVAAYGHLGRSDLDLPWEALDKVEALKANLAQLSSVS
jgi:S-adenosylmethionine synthetase